MTENRHCCYLADDVARTPCERPAEFEILTLRQDGSGDGIMAGPDPYSDDTDACREHVGALLGWQDGCRDTSEVYWTVRQIEEAP